MTARILVALDGSKPSESILQYLESLLHYQDADVVLAMAVPAGKAIAEMEAQGYLKSVAERLRRKGAVVDVEVLQGRAAEALTAYAAGGNFDLLALGSRGKNRLQRLIFGSTAEAVLKTSNVPVLVAPPLEGREAPAAIKKIVVPLDGSHRSSSVLKPAASLAKAFGAKLCFVTVVNSKEKEELPVETVAHNLFAEQKDLQKKGLDVEVAVLYGDPAKRILEFAQENAADLIAISTHGRSGLDKVFFGNVAESLLRKSHRALLVVRTAAVARTRATGHGAMKAKHRAFEKLSVAGEMKKGPYSR